MAEVGAIWRSRATTACIAGELPMTPSKPNRSLSWRWSSRFDRASRCDCETLSATVRSSPMSSGLVRYVVAPACIAVTAVLIVLWPVRITTSASGS